MHGRHTTACTAIAALIAIAAPAGAAHAQAEGEIIPAWVKQVFVYYANDQISEGELIAALTYLINNNIIEINQTPSPSPAPAPEPEHKANDAVIHTATSQLKKAASEVEEATELANVARELLTSATSEANIIGVAADRAEANPHMITANASTIAEIIEYAHEARYESGRLKVQMIGYVLISSNAADDAEHSAKQQNEWAQQSHGTAAAEYKKAAAEYKKAAAEYKKAAADYSALMGILDKTIRDAGRLIDVIDNNDGRPSG